MKFATAIIATAAATKLDSSDYEFMKYVNTFNKSYGTKEEFEFRSALFKETLAFVNEHNSGNNTHTVAINEFADMTTAEKKRLNGYKGTKTGDRLVASLDTANLADSVDWRSKGAVTPVKNQGQCGSCWSFSTTGSIEGAEFLSTGKLQSFSEQQLMDCSGSFGNMSCNGGLMDNAFKYVETTPLELEADYPYTAKDGSCHAVASKEVGKVKSFVDVQDSADQLKAAIAKTPVSVAIEADQMVFQQYSSGVITKGCGEQLDHGVLAVGYGTLKGQDYILVKNSWGASWGDQGYVRVAPNQCGITKSASYPTE